MFQSESYLLSSFLCRETVEAYALELQKLAMTLLNFMSSALKMDAEELRELFEDGFQGMRTNYYPPCPQPQLVVGLTPHSDAVGLTILLQISEVPGLEIRKDEMWVPVKPLPNAFVVNVADALEVRHSYRAERRFEIESTHLMMERVRPIF